MIRFKWLLSCLLSGFALPIALAAADVDKGSVSTEFTFSINKALPAHRIRLVWEDSFLTGIEVRTKAGGKPVQHIPVGEGKALATDLSHDNLPPNYFGHQDFNGDAYEDLYLMIAQGSDPPYAILPYDKKTGHFLVSDPVKEVRGLKFKAKTPAKAAAPAPPQSTTGRRLTRKVMQSFGLVSKKPVEAPLLSIIGEVLPQGEPVFIVQPGDPQSVLTATVVKFVEKSSEAEGESVYTLKFTPALPADEAFVGTAVIRPMQNTFTVKGGKASVEMDGNTEERVHFRVCASMEGLHLTAWMGKPLKGWRIWHRYHYLGYDTEADCTEADTKP